MIQERLTSHLQILFIGFNPSPASHATGFNYAGRNNRFYRVLHDSGLTSRLYLPSESPSLLTDYAYGFTNIVARPTKRADELTSDEYAEGRILLREKIEKYQPKVACFVGKGVYQRFVRRTNISWGFQAKPSVAGVLDFVGPGTSGLVRMLPEEQARIYAELAMKLDPPGPLGSHSGN
jgi:double-stranded uracil-DNA glycosylase